MRPFFWTRRRRVAPAHLWVVVGGAMLPGCPVGIGDPGRHGARPSHPGPAHGQSVRHAVPELHPD